MLGTRIVGLLGSRECEPPERIAPVSRAKQAPASGASDGPSRCHPAPAGLAKSSHPRTLSRPVKTNRLRIDCVHDSKARLSLPDERPARSRSPTRGRGSEGDGSRVCGVVAHFLQTDQIIRKTGQVLGSALVFSRFGCLSPGPNKPRDTCASGR